MTMHIHTIEDEWMPSELVSISNKLENDPEEKTNWHYNNQTTPDK